MRNPKDEFISPEEYFRVEEAYDSKNEYFQGVIFAMAGASLAHYRIAVNVVSDLDAALEGSDCVVFSSDVKVGVETGKHSASRSCLPASSMPSAKTRSSSSVSPTSRSGSGTILDLRFS